MAGKDSLDRTILWMNGQRHIHLLPEQSMETPESSRAVQRFLLFFCFVKKAAYHRLQR